MSGDKFICKNVYLDVCFCAYVNLCAYMQVSSEARRGYLLDPLNWSYLGSCELPEVGLGVKPGSSARAVSTQPLSHRVPPAPINPFVFHATLHYPSN